MVGSNISELLFIFSEYKDMNKLIILLIVLAVILQILGGVISSFFNGVYYSNIFGFNVAIKNDHLWWDSLFLLEITIILAIYSTK